MQLDNEKQREDLLVLLNSVTVHGIDGAKRLLELWQAVATAKIKTEEEE